MAANTKSRPAPVRAKRKATAPVPPKGSSAKKAASKKPPVQVKKAPATKGSAKSVKPAAKKTQVVKPAVKSAPKSAAKKPSVAKSGTKSPSKPAVKPVTKGVVKKSVRPVSKPVIKSSAKTVKPVSKAGQRPAVKSVAKPAAKKAVRPVAKTVLKPTAKSTPKPVVKTAAKPAASKTAVQAKTASKPVTLKNPAPAASVPVKQPSKPVVMSRPNPVMTQAAMEAERRKLAKMKESQKKPQPVVAPKIKATAARKYHPEFMKSVLDQPAQSGQTGPMIRYSDADLQEFRELITKKLEDAKRELAYWQGIITHKGEMSGDESESRYGGMEEGVSSEREYASHMASRTLDFIEKLEKALMRIQNKTYGICRVTGKLIDKARLRAVPHATLSMDAKMAMSKNPGGSHNP